MNVIREQIMDDVRVNVETHIVDLVSIHVWDIASKYVRNKIWDDVRDVVDMKVAGQVSKHIKICIYKL